MRIMSVSLQESKPLITRPENMHRHLSIDPEETKIAVCNISKHFVYEEENSDITMDGRKKKLIHLLYILTSYIDK